MAAKRMKKMLSVDYEVFGNVQGVFFRKFTEDKARELGLVGWVRNTFRGTVEGSVQGPEDQIKKMKNWLHTTGSPKSRIDDCRFNNERPVEQMEYAGFEIRREGGKKKVRHKPKKPK